VAKIILITILVALIGGVGLALSPLGDREVTNATVSLRIDNTGTEFFKLSTDASSGQKVLESSWYGFSVNIGKAFRIEESFVGDAPKTTSPNRIQLIDDREAIITIDILPMEGGSFPNDERSYREWFDSLGFARSITGYKQYIITEGSMIETDESDPAGVENLAFTFLDSPWSVRFSSQTVSREALFSVASSYQKP
jgi:hypothetical protein